MLEQIDQKRIGPNALLQLCAHFKHAPTEAQETIGASAGAKGKTDETAAAVRILRRITGGMTMASCWDSSRQIAFPVEAGPPEWRNSQNLLMSDLAAQIEPGFVARLRHRPCIFPGVSVCISPVGTSSVSGDCDESGVILPKYEPVLSRILYYIGDQLPRRAVGQASIRR